MLFQSVSRLLILICLAVTGLAACSSTASDFDSQFEATTPPDRTTFQDNTALQLKAADLVRVSVFGVDELNGEYQVDFDGNIRFPLIGTVAATGLTPVQLADELESRLGESYLQNPEVLVTLLESVGERITVDGSVVKPGIYELQGKMTLLQAVALAGGPSDGANKKKVILFRQVNGQRMAAAFNLQDIRDGQAEDPPVYGNDIVVVDGSGSRSRYDNLWRTAPLIGLIRLF